MTEGAPPSAAVAVSVAVEEWRRLLADPAVPGNRLRDLAARPDVAPEALAALSIDEARLRGSPEIAAAIYANPRAPLSVANRAIVTCHRAGVVPDGIPGFAELAAEIAADPAALDPKVVDVPFDQLVAGAPDGAAALDGAADSADGTETPSRASGVAAPRALAASAPAKSSGRRSATIDFSRLKLYEKIRLATLGNAYCRQNLLRDANRMVAMAAIRSPQITDGEIVKAAGNRSLSEDVIRYISNRKEMVKQYPVKLALVGNAKCPLAVTLRLLPSLYPDDIKQIARSKNVPGALSVAAKRLAAVKGPQ